MPSPPEPGISATASRPTRLVVYETARFLLAGLLAACLIGAGTFVVVQRTAEDQAISHAKDITTIEAQAVVGPDLTLSLLAQSAAHTTKLDNLIKARVLNDVVVRVKIWRPDGTIVYSDDHRLIGKRFPLDARQLASFNTGQVDADVSDLSDPENVDERSFGKLLEVYLPVRIGNQPFLFETYQKYSAISQYQQSVWSSFLPVLIGGIATLFLAEIPLAGSLARRLSALVAERERLLNRAITSSDKERRRIARDLHDGVVQNLTAVAVSLGTLERRLERTGDGHLDTEAAVHTVKQNGAEIRQAMRDLRTLIVEIAPPNLETEGIGNALADLLEPLAHRDIETQLSIQPDLAMTKEQQVLLFRAAQEAVRNAIAHAEPHRVEVHLTGDGKLVRLEIRDDGKGFSEERASARRRDGHVGLSLLSDLAASAGGKVSVESRPGHGTSISVELPL